ncbi:MAG: hypothetical protein FWH56_01465 [Betaproteobacteria bacterium]|nr:hypothetical protein [Betaproteobacteria bacterium]
MPTFAYDPLPVPSRTAKTGLSRRPFRTITLLAASLALAMSACKTTQHTTDGDPGRRTDPTGYETRTPTTPGDPPTSHIGSEERKQIVTSMFDQAATLGKEGKLSAAIPIYREIEQNYGEGVGNDKSWGAWAIFWQGDLQRQLRNHKAAVAAYERLDLRFGQESDPGVRAIVADALSKKGEALIDQGEVRAAIAAYEEIDRRYAGDRDAGFRQRAARALLAKGAILGRQGAGEETDNESLGMGIRQTGDTIAAIAVYDDIVQRFGRDKDPNIRNIVGGTLLRKSEALRLTGDDKGTVTVYDDIADRFGKDDAPVSRVLVATALFRKGLALGKLEGASPAAIAAFDEVTRRFASDTHPNVRKIVGQAVTARQKLITETGPMPDN